jgi:hypothetical protein
MGIEWFPGILSAIFLPPVFAILPVLGPEPGCWPRFSFFTGHTFPVQPKTGNF